MIIYASIVKVFLFLRNWIYKWIFHLGIKKAHIVIIDAKQKEDSPYGLDEFQ